jgi:hypothetical protein
MNALTFPKRDPKRSRVFLDAYVDPGTGPVQARIRDISSVGALVESDLLPEPGDVLQLTCGKVCVPAHVAWRDNGRFGLEFDAPLLMSRLVDSEGPKLKVSAPRNFRSSTRR